MNERIVIETLEKQLQLLSERSEKDCSAEELVAISNAMAAISNLLINP